MECAWIFNDKFKTDDRNCIQAEYKIGFYVGTSHYGTFRTQTECLSILIFQSRASAYPIIHTIVADQHEFVACLAFSSRIQPHLVYSPAPFYLYSPWIEIRNCTQKNKTKKKEEKNAMSATQNTYLMHIYIYTREIDIDGYAKGNPINWKCTYGTLQNSKPKRVDYWI